MKHSMRPIWMALRLTHFALESLGVRRDHDNTLVCHQHRVWACSDNLATLGIQAGMASAKAQLLYHNGQGLPCRIYERDIDREEQCLERLCHSLYDCTPHIQPQRLTTPEGPQAVGLLLELSRCTKLFKGLEALCQRIVARVATHALSHRWAVGHSAQAAWLLSYHPSAPDLATQEKASCLKALAELDIDCLQDHPKAVAGLQQSGFFRFADLLQHIETQGLASLRDRFGEHFCDALTELLDIEHTLCQGRLFHSPVASYTPPLSFCDSVQFDYPVSNSEQLIEPINALLRRLCDTLVKKQIQTQSLRWQLYSIHQQQQSFDIHLERLHRDHRFAAELSLLHFAERELPFEIDTLELQCEHFSPVANQNQCLDRHHHIAEQHAFASTLAKLQARLGEHAVYSLSPKDSHIPELSFRRAPARIQHSSSLQSLPASDRPSWIFNTPIAIGRRQNDLYWQGTLHLLQGPERIEGLWWKKATARDYFVARRNDDVRLWIFHDLHKDAWFVHGVFA